MEKPKVLVFDLETTGGLKAHMSSISAFGYKWLGEPASKTKIISWLDFPKSKFYNDKPLLKEASKIWNSSDCTIAHYGERFDRRFLNSRLEKHMLAPLKPVRLVDTWRLSRDNLALHSNGLAALLQFFRSPYQKIDLTYEEWRAVQHGDRTAQKKLNAHCAADVLGLEYIFSNHLAHYAKTLPNMVVALQAAVCPCCGAGGLQKKGFAYKQTKIWQRYYCRGCMKWSEAPIAFSGREGIIR